MVRVVDLVDLMSGGSSGSRESGGLVDLVRVVCVCVCLMRVCVCVWK